MRSRTLAGAISVPVLLFCLAALSNNSGNHPSPSARRAGGFFPSQPIPGQEVSFLEAQEDATFPVPTLPAVTLPDPCTEQDTTLTLVASWVAVDQVGKSNQLGFTFNDGVWVSVTSLTEYDASSTSQAELLPVEKAFSPEDYPVQLQTGTVNEHTAWTKDIDPQFSCETAATVPVALTGAASSTPGSSAPQPRGPVMYDPTLIGDVTWAENGVVLDIAGPYDVGILTSIAEKVSFHK